MSNLGKVSVFLGMVINHHPSTGPQDISQGRYVWSILEHFGMMNCNPAITLGERTLHPHNPLLRTEDAKMYQELVGSLNYLLPTCTRSDISFTVMQLSHLMGKPAAPSLSAAKQLFRYLKGTMDLPLHYNKCTTFNLMGLADASYGRIPGNGRTVSGFIFTLSGAAIMVIQGLTDRGCI
ncbi:unnamed protein product [Discosporangium mesarthrocarpum]